ncbi:uncharacterized protein LOC115569598 [Sparus aurata]|uniref:uncharacterized protein LOC115569598 n=1 Tax=Sparus aurata TaxID=8175 RepID=UPI0011C13765|nr:uncharacterized protein LOC115569598 [Sparus aurata]
MRLGSSSTNEKTTSSQRTAPVWRVLTDEDIQELRDVYPGAAVLTSLDNSDTDTASSDTDSEEHPDLPEPLTALFDTTLRDLSPQEMEVKCEDTFHKLKTTLHPHQCEKLEFVTRQQSRSNEWHTYRAGRITSTKFHHATTTDKISKTYLNDIMQYNKTELNVPSVLWGKNMEETARQAYTAFMSQSHPEFSISSCGLVVQPSEPHLGSSPDGIARCTCCGKGVVEIKCPYKYRNSLQGCTEDEQFCLDKSFSLKHSHTYYYQTQLHMFVCGVSYCDFVLWTKEKFIVQRILRNEEFLQEALPKAHKFFISSVLPELLTRRHDPVLVSQRACEYCEKPDFGRMIICVKCNNHIHYSCAQIKRKPATWSCKKCLRVEA